VKISMRLPPGCNPKQAAQSMKEVLEKDPPHGAQVSFSFNPDSGAVGWSAPEEKEWLLTSLSNASKTYFSGNDVAYIGEGGTIPFMGMLGREFPTVQFVITGVLGPKSNAHGPNEFLHVPFAKKLTHAVADVLVDTFNHITKKA
jgi:acetylornithine deacetylase/succinyl-diaminopimelate desuccinylase-like protein